MTLDVPLDYAVFQLSPRRSHCELFVSYNGNMERLASGLVKPFVSHLKVAEEQVASAVESIKLEVERYKNAESWFTKGTLERFVRFVSTPEVLEMVNTYDAEMSQLEAARRIYSQEVGENQSKASGGDGAGAIAASDVTKKELLRAIDVRLTAVKQDLTTACSHAFAAGFNPESVSELHHFADRFGAHRLSEACSKFIELSQKRPDLFSSSSSNNSTWKSSSDRTLRSSTSSDMSLDSPSGDQPKTSTSKVTFPLRRFSREPSPRDESDDRENMKDRDNDKDKDQASGPTTSTMTSSTTEADSLTQSSQTPKLTRRLSVQERISLFESKQKENSPSTATPSPTSAGIKPDVRRLPSDVASSSDKAVLRRWSGASDMSIDVSGERKESDSNCKTPTPTSSSTLHVLPVKSGDQIDLKGEEGDKEKDLKVSKLPVREKFGAQLAVFSGSGSGPGSEEPVSSDANSRVASFSTRSSENSGLKDRPPSGSGIRSRAASVGRGEDLGFENQTSSVQTQFKSLPGKTEQFSSLDLTSSPEKTKGPAGGCNRPQDNNVKDFEASDGHQGVTEDDEVRDQPVPRSQFRSTQRRGFEVESEPAASEFHSQTGIESKGGEVNSLPEPRWKSFAGEVEKVGRKDFEPFEKQSEILSVQNSISLRSKFQGHGPVSERMKKTGGGREERGFGFGSNQLGFPGTNALETDEVLSSTSIEPMDQVQKIKQSKGNQELNDELKMKANELEKLFAEHKLRVPADQSNSARRTRPAEAPKEQEGSIVNRKPVVEVSPAQLKMVAETASGSSNMKYNSTPLMKSVDNQDFDVTPKHNIHSLGFSDDSRGKLYQKYMQKRDAKLREDWSLRRAEKEAKMKAMQDSLEKSRAEMMSKLAGSADKRNYVRDSGQRAEKLKSFNVRSAKKREQPIDSFMSEEDEDQSEFLRKKLSETFLGDSSSRGVQSKKVLPNKNVTSSTPRNSVLPVPRSSGKGSNSAAGRRRFNSDNPLAQSVPNFSDLKKENTKPSSAGSKPVRSQARNHVGKKSSSEDLSLVSEEKPRRSQSLKKSSANPMELNDSINSNDAIDSVFMLSKYEKEENEDYDKLSKHIEVKAFPKKGGIGRSNPSLMMEAVRNGHDLDDVSFETEEMTDATKEEDDEFETTMGGESVDMDNSKERQSQESDKSAISGYENSDSFRFSQARPASVTDASMPSLFRTMGSIQDSPGGSPGSWNLRVQNPFSFSHEVSDIDVSDSPIGSPASWNFHMLASTEAEAARMRKKWGAAQKPIVGTDSSHSRKDVTKGLKRFLKFGRKNRAAESLADWVSATTSEGDDDTEDGRDPAYRSSEDLRKSRMGFSHSNHSDDGFNGSDLFNEQVHALQSSIPTPPANFKLRDEHLSGSSLKAPKSFFSLSNFRSKGSDSKPR